MSMRKVVNVFRKRNQNSSASTASSSPTHSPLNTPMSSSVSLPESIHPRATSGSSAIPPQHLTSPYPPAGGLDTTRNTPPAAISSGKQPSLQDVAPFVYAGNHSASSSSSSLPETYSGNGGPGLRLKRSLTKLLSNRDSDSNEPTKPGPFDQPKRTGLFGSTSFFDENRNGGGSKGWVRRVSNLPGGMVKKAQDALKGASLSATSSNKSMQRVSISPMEFLEDEEDDSSISSAPSFVQTAPDEEDRGMLSSEPPIPPMMQAYNNLGVPYLPRSHTNLHALTLTSLAFPPSPHPLLYHPSQPCFPRSSNHPSKLPRLPTFRVHLAKTRILDRLEAQDLTVIDNESIVPFANKAPPNPNNRSEGDVEPPPEGEIRKIENEPGWSVGLDSWMKRAAFVERVREWRVVGTELLDEEPEPSTSHKTQVKISGGVRALAGLVDPRPSSLKEVQPKAKSIIIDESMLMDYLDQEIVTPPLPISPQPSGSMSPRPLPNPPGAVRPPVLPDSPILSPVSPPIREELARLPPAEADHAPYAPRIRRLPPRPLPVPPSPPSQITVREVESMEGPVVMTTKVFDMPTSSARISLDPFTHNRLSQVMVTSSAPNTPLDPLDSEGVRVSVGSLAAAVASSNASASESPLMAPRMRVTSLDSISSLDPAAEHAIHSPPHYEKRKSMASVRVPIHESQTPQTPRSPQRQSSRVSSTAPTPPALHGTLSVPSLRASASSMAPSEDVLERKAGPEPKSQASPAVIIAEPVAIEPEEVPLEPSRISEEHVDPFFIASLNAKTSIPPIPSASSLSTITTSPVPSTSNQSAKSTAWQSSDGASGTPLKSSTSLYQSSVVENLDLDAPVKFIKLRRTESGQIPSRMRKNLLHNSGKFWPPQRGKDDDTVEEKGESEMERTPSIKSSKSKDVGGNNHEPTMSQESLTSGSASSATKAEKLDIDDWNFDAPRVLPFSASTSSHKRNFSDYRRPSLEDGTRGMVPMTSAFDLGRSYPTARSPDNLTTPRWERPHSPTRTTAKDLVQHIPVAPMSPSKPLVVGRVVHTRSPSSDTAARIEAHLNDVHIARFRAKGGSLGQGRPDFLPMPTITQLQLPPSSDASTVRSISPNASTSTASEAGYHPAQPQPASSLDQTHSTSRVVPPSRWSEENWKERQRTAGTLPLPTTTISLPSSRTLPIGVSNSASRGTLGGTEPSRGPSIFRPPMQNTINGRKRTLGM